MHSWVRYSVSAYLGLLIAGSVATPELAPAGPEPVASIYHDAEPIYLPEAPLLHRPHIRPQTETANAQS